MAILSGAVGLYNKTKKKEDTVSQAALLQVMENSSSSKEFLKNMDEYLKEQSKAKISIQEQIKTQQNRLNLSDQYLDELPIDQGISQVKQIGTMAGTAAVALADQAISTYIDVQAMKSRDITKQSRIGNMTAAAGKTIGLIGSVAGGMVAGTMVAPGIGTVIGGIIGGLTYAGSQVINEIGSRAKEKFETEQANKQAEINRLTSGSIYNEGNRQSK